MLTEVIDNAHGLWVKSEAQVTPYAKLIKLYPVNTSAKKYARGKLTLRVKFNG